MSYQTERDEFIARMAKEGLPTRVSRAILSAAQTLHRLSEAQCNGDWPADNGQRDTAECVTCGSHWHPSVLKGKDRKCPDCRMSDRVRAMLPEGFGASFAGDPRGYVLLITVPSGAVSYGGAEGIGVPTR